MSDPTWSKLYTDTFPITPSDITPVSKPSNVSPAPYAPTGARGIYVLTAGNLKLQLRDGGQITLTGVAANTILPFAVQMVFATGTTATIAGLM